MTPYIQGIPRNLFSKTLYKLLKYYIAKIIREDPTHNLNANDFFHVLGNKISTRELSFNHALTLVVHKFIVLFIEPQQKKLSTGQAS